MNYKKLAAALTALVLSYGALQTSERFAPQLFTAYAEEQSSETVSFDEATGTLTLKGNIIAAEVRKYNGNEKVLSKRPSAHRTFFSDSKANSLQFPAAKL